MVHPEQAHKIYTALKKKGLPVALVEYEGEPHGFRKVFLNNVFELKKQFLEGLNVILVDTRFKSPCFRHCNRFHRTLQVKNSNLL